MSDLLIIIIVLLCLGGPFVVPQIGGSLVNVLLLVLLVIFVVRAARGEKL